MVRIGGGGSRRCGMKSRYSSGISFRGGGRGRELERRGSFGFEVFFLWGRKGRGRSVLGCSKI